MPYFGQIFFVLLCNKLQPLLGWAGDTVTNSGVLGQSCPSDKGTRETSANHEQADDDLGVAFQRIQCSQSS